MSAFCWFCLLSASALILYRQRAIASFSELNTFDADSSSTTVRTALGQVERWIQIKWILKGRSPDISERQLAPLFTIADSLLAIRQLPDTTLRFSCAFCSPVLQSNLNRFEKMVPMLVDFERKQKELQAEIAELTRQKQQQISMHVLLAADFADLIGSPSRYKPSDNNELLYYENGPFRWLPKLDQGAYAFGTGVPDFGRKLSLLQAQSRQIVQRCDEISDKLSKQIAKTSEVEEQKKAAELRMRRLLLMGFKAEVQAF